MEREGDNCSCTVCCQDILLPLCLYTLATNSSKHVHFYEAHINHSDTHIDTVPGISSVTVIAVSQKKYVDRLIRAAVSRAFHGIPLFPVMSLPCFLCWELRYVTLCSICFLPGLQEALASFDLRASHGLSHDPMPVRDEENRYWLLSHVSFLARVNYWRGKV